MENKTTSQTEKKRPNEKTLDKPIVIIGKEDFQTAFFSSDFKYCKKQK
jgi:hypothetical protein|tara:strand:+ start:864 stop:1007 length:144 start_codon:yes stop_codon:yes gene_type:complete